MQKHKFKSVCAVIFIANILIPEINAGTISEDLRLHILDSTQTLNVVIEFPSVVDQVLADPSVSSIADTFANRRSRRNAIINAAKLYTSEMQKPVLEQIQALRLIHNCQPFWVANKIVLEKADLASVITLASLKENFIIRHPVKVSLHTGLVDFSSSKPTIENGVKADPPQWGVNRINAPLVWGNGNIGSGITVANIDTGVNYLHEALRTNFAADGAGWFDPFGNTTTPFDDNGHGTHTMGTICGTTNGIGVAPGATWKACKIFDKTDSRSGTEGVVTECFQWVACPAIDPSTGDCIGFIDVVNNSWGAGENITVFNDIITLLHAIGTFQFFSIGNSGPDCKTSNSPGDQSIVISVGATDISENDTIGGFSSRGVGPNGIKPDVTAPGVNIVSADSKNISGYATESGTSMACPHVSGTVALMLSVNYPLNYDEVSEILRRTARKLPLADLNGDFSNLCTDCDGTSCSPPVPNNVYGSGRIDAASAVALALTPEFNY